MAREQSDKLAEIKEVMLDYGIEPGVRGFEQLAYCILYRSEDRFASFGTIFEKAAESTGTTAGVIPHCIRCVIERSPEFPKRIEETIGIKYSSYFIFPSLAISYLERFYKLPFPRPKRKKDGKNSDAIAKSKA